MSLLALPWSRAAVVLLALAVVFGVLRRFRAPDPRRLMRERLEEDAAHPLKRWVQSVFLLITRDCDYAYLRRSEARQMLDDWWDIRGEIEFRRTLDGLRSTDRPDNAWDLVRYILVARLGVGAGYWTDPESWDALRPIARRLQRAYPGWSAMAQAYVHARRQWRGLALDGSEDDEMMHWILENAARLRDERWRVIPFDADLDESRL